MKSVFARFPEVILADTTHNTNINEMPFYALMCVDGNGLSHIVCGFLVYTENELTLKKMSIFKERNDHYVYMKVIITDKDMRERKVFKDLFPQVEMQICFFHVLCTFSREFTIDKMGITIGERTTLLVKAEVLAYAKDEPDYEEKYADFCSICPHDRVKQYFNKWHSIKRQWVEGLKKPQFNLGESTNNRLESFFQKLKTLVKVRLSMPNFFFFCFNVVYQNSKTRKAASNGYRPGKK
jgi:hypothetical protein